MTQFKHIGILGFIDKPMIRDTLKRLCRFLIAKDVVVYFEDSIDIAELAEESDQIKVCSRDKIGRSCDLMMVVGGDGSMLQAARDFVNYQLPILGVNRGRLGFLTDIPPQELEERITEVLQGDYEPSERFLLNVELYRDDERVDQSVALNDVVLQPSGSISVIEFELSIDGAFVYRQRSDGLIVSTPTGSTAYALSGGGSIIHPSVEAINLVPINPHTLSSRPILVRPDVELSVFIPPSNRVEAFVVCDGQDYLDAQLGDTVKITQYKKKVTLLHPKGHSFYASCRRKLNWAADQ